MAVGEKDEKKKKNRKNFKVLVGPSGGARMAVRVVIHN